jgi:hypothetical protein
MYSHSRFAVFESCPQKYKWQFIEKIKGTLNPSRRLGSTRRLYLRCSVAAMVLLLLASGVVSSHVFAYPEKYGPFESRQEPALFLLHECQPIESPATLAKSSPKTYVVNRSASVRLNLGVATNQTYYVTITDAAGKWLGGQQELTESVDIVRPEVYTADLNKDGQPDFVVWIGHGGCGLAAENSLMVLALSSGAGYKIVTQETMFASERDFIDVRRDGSCQFISTSFLHSEKGKDGKPHNYRAYELYEIKGTEIRKANHLLPGFPKLVWYSFRENHKETDQLTNEQKALLLTR